MKQLVFMTIAIVLMEVKTYFANKAYDIYSKKDYKAKDIEIGFRYAVIGTILKICSIVIVVACWLECILR